MKPHETGHLNDIEEVAAAHRWMRGLWTVFWETADMSNPVSRSATNSAKLDALHAERDYYAACMNAVLAKQREVALEIERCL